jgi:hypothetical protein
MIAPSIVYDSATSIAQVYDGTKHSWNTKWQFNKVTNLCIRMKDVASLSFVIHDDSEIVIIAYHQYPQFWNPRPNLENILGIGDNFLSRPALKLSVNYHQYRTCSLFQCISPITATNRPRKMHVTDVYHKWSHFIKCVILYQRR